MDPNTAAQPPPNPPSVEAAYKRKCIQLKKRLNEIEAENDLMRARNKRGLQYVQKMRLESCILLERLAKVTGMAEEAQAGVNPELRARAAAMMSNAAAMNNMAAGIGGVPPPGTAPAPGAGGNGTSYLDDETEGSSEDQPPTPQERPLRVKRSRKSNINNLDLELGEENANNTDSPSATGGGAAAGAGGASSSLPPLAPAPSQEELTSSFRVRTGSNGSAAPAAANNNNNAANVVPTDTSPTAPPTTAMDVDTKEPKEESRG
ncbi:hypothetical protein VTN00DRAFT_1940 [Thermoascus crustaceus]|uniref:uncharacterized protein n=1 Tax=Thermoascus crustaceus TaxID=5088 RepID=UPI0037435CC4